MPAARTSTRQRDRRSNDPTYNTLINDTLERVRTGEIASFNEATRQTEIPRSTLTDRAKKSARLDLFAAKPPQCVSEVEDRHRNYEELFHEVRSLREQLWATHEALGRALGQLSAANAHCTSIHRELGSVRQELETVTKKKQPRSSKKIKARFHTSEALRDEFEREDAEQLEREKAAAEKDKQKRPTPLNALFVLQMMHLIVFL